MTDDHEVWGALGLIRQALEEAGPGLVPPADHTPTTIREEAEALAEGVRRLAERQ
jgi:hypothetical protein